MSGADRIVIVTLVGVAAAAAVVTFREDVVWLFSIGQAPSASATSTAQEAGSIKKHGLTPLAASPPPIDEPDSAPGLATPSQAAFDVIRIDPEGTSVFAGRGRPRSELSILTNGVSIATVTTSEQGQWAIALTRRFAPGDYEFALTYGAGDEAAPSGQRVALHVPAPSPPPLVTAATAAPHEPLVDAAEQAEPPSMMHDVLSNQMTEAIFSQDMRDQMMETLP